MYYWNFVISWWFEHNFFFDKDSYSGGLKAISRLSAFLVNMNSKKKFPSPSSINVVFLFFDVSLTHLGTSKLLSTNHWWHGKLSCLKKKSNIIVKSVFFAPLPIYWNRFFVTSVAQTVCVRSDICRPPLLLLLVVVVPTIKVCLH